jgi:hypothetical protein
MARANNGGVDLAMLTAAGRERGPDIVLNVVRTGLALPAVPANAAVNGIITPDSSITEVLNIVAYLTIPTATRLPTAIPANPIDAPWFNKEHSVTPATIGQYGVTDPATGYYTNTQGPLDNSLFQAAGPVAGNILYNLDTMAVVPAGAPALDVIPVCIRRRAAPAAAAIGAVADTAAAGANGNIPAAAGGNVLVTSLMSDCIKQMIHILENTRTIFGPKGWTALFNQVKGGGGKNHAKRTRRQHRRKYSSKHY